MKSIFISIVLLFTSLSIIAQGEMSSSELRQQLLEGKNLVFENVSFIGDLILPDEDLAVETGSYPENGKTAVVLTNFIKQEVRFENCTFKGMVLFCKKYSTPMSIKEYRIEFSESVVFENCNFEKIVDLELTNFNKGLSFKGSTFLEQARFLRMGLYQKPNIADLTLAKDCVFQFDQSKKEQIFTTQELQKLVETMN